MTGKPALRPERYQGEIKSIAGRCFCFFKEHQTMIVYFRLRMRNETAASYEAAKAAWEASMRRCGLKTA